MHRELKVIIEQKKKIFSVRKQGRGGISFFCKLYQAFSCLKRIFLYDIDHDLWEFELMSETVLMFIKILSSY